MNSFKNFLLNTFFFCRIFNTAKHEKEKLENKINEQKQMINEQMEDINFRKAFISKPLINTLYKLYCKKNHRDVK